MKLALLALLTVGPALGLADETTQLTAADLALDRNLHKVARAGGPSWLNRSTPPFPDGASWVVFGYAWALSSSISDGELTGSIHGEARPQSDGEAGKVVVKALGPVRNVGTQGVHPVMPGKWPSPADMNRAYAWVVDGHTGEVPAYVQRTYCAWQDGNGVIKKELPGSARAFLTSLGCK